MSFHVFDLMEPEETVGNLWHDYASRFAATRGHEGAAVTLEAMRPSVAVLFRALGGPAGVEIGESPATAARHRRGLGSKLGETRILEHVAGFDGERLRLPPVLDCFPSADLNRAAYLWLAALAAQVDLPEPAGPLAFDLAQIAAMEAATARVLSLAPGLADVYRTLSAHVRLSRETHAAFGTETAVEERVRAALGGTMTARAHDLTGGREPSGYAPFAPVPLWLRLSRGAGGKAASNPDETNAPASLPTTTRKVGQRRDLDQANRKDGFIVHRFEAILSWVEALNINRATDDDDQENAQKAAEDQDHITLTQHFKRAASRLRLHLDLAPQDADHERLSDRFTYPEWNHRSKSLLPDHCRVLEAEAEVGPGFAPDLRLMTRVRRQFETLHPRRILCKRQVEGAELDLDALIEAQVALRTTGRGSDRIYLNSRAIERDLSVAILMDCSRSTEAVVGDRSVIDTAREALAALAGGIDVAGDRLAIWGFSSLRRDRVFLKKCKGFDEPMGETVTGRIGGLRPGHYTRLGAAIRHASAMLAGEAASRKLLLVLTDGKPNDLDHYEGIHGIEDSRMAVREARALAQSVHGVIVDADGQDWFARIFGRAGFTLLPDPARLSRALPDIYRSLTQEI
ncbi:VWA domain-containing protein [Cereibacter sphaeroides]|uniref:nitric oxide reductase activation protein NorD n=1 Tax=Cereibacter sphaeroides TaxID=1063 RepID=UPI001F336013|nr:VWA domain-containing protein [Cereibacter sphaeroides]MCE6960475.1 VWA domain-containing protein [Cereibacter sphaeroides]MCE6975483.1 VWA domain-containing protein [Cereibacter sphaeroides]